MLYCSKGQLLRLQATFTLHVRLGGDMWVSIVLLCVRIVSSSFLADFLQAIFLEQKDKYLKSYSHFRRLSECGASAARKIRWLVWIDFCVKIMAFDLLHFLWPTHPKNPHKKTDKFYPTWFSLVICARALYFPKTIKNRSMNHTPAHADMISLV